MRRAFELVTGVAVGLTWGILLTVAGVLDRVHWEITGKGIETRGRR